MFCTPTLALLHHLKGQGLKTQQNPVVHGCLRQGLAVHSWAVTRQARAAVAGLPLGVINARLEVLALDHVWDADGSLADFCSVSCASHGAAGGF